MINKEDKNKTLISWTGEIVKIDEPWYDKKLFSIADFDIT